MIIDTNVYLSRWPFRRLAGDAPAELVARLRARQVTQAWAGSFDALLQHDLGAVNARLAADCRRFGAGLLMPFGCVNPKAPDWREELRRCHEEHRMPGIRLHPNYHGYALDDLQLRELLDLAARRKLIVQIAAMMEDDRTVHPLVKVGPADLKPLPAVLGAIPGLRVQLTNYRAATPELMRALAAAGQVYADFSMIEGVYGLERLAQDITPRRVVFGSYFPFYYWEAARLKLKESGLAEQPVLEGNARRLMGGSQ
jgi:predicted TIM-barrel fold metal-dependent hydrolase